MTFSIMTFSIMTFSITLGKKIYAGHVLIVCISVVKMWIVISTKAFCLIVIEIDTKS
jgi:hypothetical protein